MHSAEGLSASVSNGSSWTFLLRTKSKLVWDARKYDETVIFKWFSWNFDSDVSTLSAQTDVLPLPWLSAMWLQQEPVDVSPKCMT